MAGDSIAHAKRGVALALNSLSPADRFAVIGFGSHTLAFDPSLQPGNRKSLKLAEEFVDQLPNLGGTEMGLALELAMSYGLPLDILLLTDGECWSLGDAAMRTKAAGTRIFSVGIGSAVAEDTVRMLADETCGACELLTPLRGPGHGYRRALWTHAPAAHPRHGIRLGAGARLDSGE